MLLASVTSSAVARDTSLQSADLFWAHPQVLHEMREVLTVLNDAPDHLQHQAMADIPLRVHGRYTRIDILAAVGTGEGARVPDWREGVYDAAGIGASCYSPELGPTSEPSVPWPGNLREPRR